MSCVLSPCLLFFLFGVNSFSHEWLWVVRDFTFSSPWVKRHYSVVTAQLLLLMKKIIISLLPHGRLLFLFPLRLWASLYPSKLLQLPPRCLHVCIWPRCAGSSQGALPWQRLSLQCKALLPLRIPSMTL